jgi:protein-tyrosine phosphatase
MIMFHQAVDVMGGYLKDTFNATDEELTYLDEILNLRGKKRESATTGRHTYGSPSVVIDDFLYHGDLGHASNLKLLNQLGIRHIIDVCDLQLDKQILENFNVLWINLNDELKADIKKHFDETNQFLYDCKQKNEKVLVNCQMGISRSSSIVLAYLMK